MKITVWGGSGFLGSYICDALSLEGYEVTIADIKPSPWIREGQQMIIGSVLDKEVVALSIKDADYVFNLSGVADIDEANNNPSLSAETNILGNLNLLAACTQAKVKRYIFSSTLYVYSKLGGFYRCSKQACESYIEEYHHRFGLDYTVLRFGSLYGIRSDEQNAIYRFILEALTLKKISYYGSPDALREYIHAEDAARIVCKILDYKFKNQFITITGHQSMRIIDLFEMIKEMLGENIEYNFDNKFKQPHYKITPYNFNPKLGVKYSPELQTDMGQGLLQIMEDVHNELNKRK